MDKVHHVGMADMVVVSAPESLVTLGLGSCIGLVLFDQTAKVAGMVHIMLPDSRGAGLKALEKPGKFADTAVPALIAEVCRKGAVRSRLKAKMAGGSQMFTLPGAQTDFLAVGSRNAKETEALLKQHGIPIAAMDTGGNKGRTVEFSTKTWMLTVKVLGKGTAEI
ncbi:chemotaxis protein CheD [Aminivibrio sp.]|jgi:chemotaxis protein CheD|uniref:chemotaxis protein CheD n=1 Tax=Aminivibrio sp. TaxID=1872489 RepID=UPI001A3E2858|nr:chemotaxis protein CheD [Aminivibrio sp.]MBL3540701.1 chemotaxis protein CheD [Aminivibrio sp.]MDK2958730.1 chemotaxis protein CheD [Synergistaceae bacterium]